MDEYGRLIPAENRFPSAKGGQGFKPIADYVHSLGLKFEFILCVVFHVRQCTKTQKSKAVNLLPVRLRTISAYAHGTPICTE